MDLRTYLNTLTPPDQIGFAHRCGTTIGYLRKALSVGQKLGEGLCINIDRESAGVVPCEDLRPDVDWAYLRATNCQKVGAGDTAPVQPEAAVPARALACSSQSVRLTADRRQITCRAKPEAEVQPDQLPLLLDDEGAA